MKTPHYMAGRGVGGAGLLAATGLSEACGHHLNAAIFYCLVTLIWFKWGLFGCFYALKVVGPSGPWRSVRVHCEPGVGPSTLCASPWTIGCPCTPPPARPSAPLTHSSGFPHLQPVSYAKRAALCDPPSGKSRNQWGAEIASFFHLKWVSISQTGL